MKTDFYFTTSLTESEHYIVEDMIRQECAKQGIVVAYYRKFKTGHVPCKRECKLLTLPHIGQEILKNLDVSWGNYFKDSKEYIDNVKNSVNVKHYD